MSGGGTSSSHGPMCKVRAPFSTVTHARLHPLLTLDCQKSILLMHLMALQVYSRSLELKHHHLNFKNPEDGIIYSVETNLAQSVGRCFLDEMARDESPLIIAVQLNACSAISPAWRRRLRDRRARKVIPRTASFADLIPPTCLLYPLYPWISVATVHSEKGQATDRHVSLCERDPPIARSMGSRPNVTPSPARPHVRICWE